VPSWSKKPTSINASLVCLKFRRVRIHIRFRWGDAEFSAVKEAEDVDHPFLKKKIDGIFLALSQSGQMKFSGFFQR